MITPDTRVAAHPTSFLFVPGSRPDRFEKALESGADRVIIDLEDAVAPGDKPAAREALAAALTKGLPRPVLVRVNSIDTADCADDIQTLFNLPAEAKRALLGVVFPKVESPIALRHICTGFSEGLELIPMIESARGLHLIDELVSIPKVTRVAVGAEDLSVDLDAENRGPLLDYAYAQLVIASRLAGKASPIASPPLAIHDEEVLEVEARRLRSLGVHAQLCIHPAQVAPIHRGFGPTSDEVAWARDVVAASGAAVQVAGQMVDKPVRERAERILAQADRSKS